MLLGATHQVKLTGAPFTAVAKVGGSEDSQAVNERYSGVAAKFWDRLVTGRDVLAGLILINVIHLGISTRQNSQGTITDKCAVNSWLIIFLECGTLALLLASNVIRSENPLSIAAEAILAVLFISVAIVLAGASGPHRWALQQNESDLCSAQTNPHAAQVYWLADILGTGSAILVVVSFFVRAPIKNMPLLSAVLLGVVLVVFQLAVIDPYVVDEISQIWKTVEANGTAIDGDLQTITDRVESLETLFNVTI